MIHALDKRIKTFLGLLIFFSAWTLAVTQGRCQTFVSGKVITSDGMVVASGAVALEKGELHNNAFIAGGEIGSDGTFKIPLPSGGPWGLHVYSEGYIYFPLQIRVTAGMDNEVPVILPLDGKSGDDPRISNIRFSKISDGVFQISIRVDDPDNNLGPQMLAVDKKRFRAYRLLPVKGDLKNKKANFPVGDYTSPFIPVALDGEDLGDWLFAVADHQCSNGVIYNGLNQSVHKPPVPQVEKLLCEVPGIWKSNFEKVYQFTRKAPGKFSGKQFEGDITVEKLILQKKKLVMDFRFQGQKGKAELQLSCKDNDVKLKGTFNLPGRSGNWIFTKLKNAKMAQSGKDLFKANCSVCHYHDRSDTKKGPGLLKLFKNPRLPLSNLPTSEKTIRTRIINGGDKMPPFKHLKEEEIKNIIDYLKTL
jgi:cytochrome c5